MSKKSRISIVLLAIIIFSLGCTRERAKLGSENNPVKLFFVPSVDAKVIEDNSRVIKKYLEEQTGYQFEVAIPTSYVAVVEAFGTKRADVAALNTFGYILAHEKYGAEAKITVLRHGSSTYRSQVLVHKDSGIKKLSQLSGKKVAFVDPASTSGYLLPLKLFKDHEVEPSDTVFASKHDNVVSMIYQKQVDGGATFYSPEDKQGAIQDARRLVKQQYPDVEKKVVILELTEPIPNDPIVFRKGMPEDMKQKIVKAFMDLVETDHGRGAFNKIYGVTGLKKASDADYDGVRTMLQSLNKSAQDLMK